MAAQRLGHAESGARRAAQDGHLWVRNGSYLPSPQRIYSFWRFLRKYSSYSQAALEKLGGLSANRQPGAEVAQVGQGP